MAACRLVRTPANESSEKAPWASLVKEDPRALLRHPRETPLPETHLQSQPQEVLWVLFGSDGGGSRRVISQGHGNGSSMARWKLSLGQGHWASTCVPVSVQDLSYMERHAGHTVGHTLVHAGKSPFPDPVFYLEPSVPSSPSEYCIQL